MRTLEQRLLAAIEQFEKLGHPTSRLIEALGKGPGRWGRPELDYLLKIFPTVKWRQETPFYHTILIDGSWMVHKAYQSDDEMGAFGALLKSLLWLKKTYRHDRIVFCWDTKTSHEARQKINTEYKANRDPKPEAFVEFKKNAQALLHKMGSWTCTAEGFEGDDCIAAMAYQRETDEKVLIYSTDKDLFQLVSDNVHFHRSTPTEEKLYSGRGAKISIKSVNFNVDEFPYAQALMGDSTDNIPGVPGIGAAKARLLLDVCPEWIRLVCTKQEVSEEIQKMLDEKQSDKLIQKLLQNADKAAESFDQVMLYSDITPVISPPPPIDKDDLYTLFKSYYVQDLYQEFSKLKFLHTLK